MTAGPRVVGLRGLERSLALFHQALSDRPCSLVPYENDAHERQHPDTASSVRLPSHVQVPEAARTDAEWYRVAVAHRAMHHELGTFSFDLSRDEPFFRRLRPSVDLQERNPLEVFFGSFSRPVFAVEVFAALEDLRIDESVIRTWKGLRRPYNWVREDALASRPDLAELPPRTAAAEVLVRLSLGLDEIKVPESLRSPVLQLASVAAVLTSPKATVETSAEATVRAYSVLARLPNLGTATGPPTRVSLDGDDAELREQRSYSLGTKEVRLEGSEVFDVRFAPVRYRDVPGPRYLGQQASGMPLREAILRTTAEAPAPVESSEELSQKSQQAESGQVDVTNTARAAPPPEPLPHDHGPDLDGHHHATEGPLQATARGEYVYPEWDDVASAYLSDWCRVRESRPRIGGSAHVYRQAVMRHRHLLPELVAELRRVGSDGLRRVHRTRFGDELHLDACIEATVDLRVGVTPSEAIYTDVTRDARDVVVAFAVDLSSSTAERLPVDPRRPGEVRRILDVEREAVCLLVAALERVGDSYGIYGFSGTGRQDVRLRVVKDIAERRSPAMLHRIEGLRPEHTTRMGPVIRHLARKLKNDAAPTKLLMVISDGRPFDLDYGQQYGDEAVLPYALADTARALQEARDQGVRPYLVTVDALGDDYLRTICDPDEYHVLDDARGLPASLASLYLAARSRRRRNQGELTLR